MISQLLYTRISVIWALLLSLTLISWDSSGGGDDAWIGGLIVIGIAMFKVLLIVREFMEVRTAPRALAVGVQTGIFVVAITLMTLCWKSRGL